MYAQLIQERALAGDAQAMQILRAHAKRGNRAAVIALARLQRFKHKNANLRFKTLQDLLDAMGAD